jgi:hypothetical protein
LIQHVADRRARRYNHDLAQLVDTQLRRAPAVVVRLAAKPEHSGPGVSVGKQGVEELAFFGCHASKNVRSEGERKTARSRDLERRMRPTRANPSGSCTSAAHPPGVAGPSRSGVVSSDVIITTMKGALRTALATGILTSVGVGVLGMFNAGAGTVAMWSKACGGDKALHADPPAFSRCMRAVPPWAD